MKAEDRLFATLDPTTREVALPGGGSFTDGYGRLYPKLPHHLVAAFRATLEEVTAAVAAAVVDTAHPQARGKWLKSQVSSGIWELKCCLCWWF